MASKEFIINYWNYYLELEEQFLKSKRYVSFDLANDLTFSSEYVQLIQAICSEIDVIGKVIAQFHNKNFKVDNRTNITKWGFEVQKAYPNLDHKSITFNNVVEIVPFKNWKYKNGTSNRHPIVLFNESFETPMWWRDYNKIKHERTTIDNETKTANFRKANLRNIRDSLGALFILEMFLLSKYGGINLETHTSPSVRKSNLFSYSLDEVIKNNTLTSSTSS